MFTPAVDVHNGEFEPVVYHRKTLTTKASVRDICRAIDKYAFVTSPYPVIISAEIHCGSDQQARLATIMRDIFGDKLVTSPIEGHDLSGLPSPEVLKRRILFKAKPRVESDPPSPPSSAVDSAESTAESDTGLARFARRLSISPPSLSPDRPSFSNTLSDLLVYTAGIKYQGFSKLITYQPRHQFSVSESTANRIIRENKADWVKHNLTHMSRVYPKAIRMLSTNFDPTPYWSAGCQLVAMNWQTIDPGTVLNHAMFADTPGYVLKPLAIRQKVAEVPRTWRVRVEIISAQRLPLASSSDLYVEATLDGMTKRTAQVKGTALNPRWNEAIEWTIICTSSEFDLTFLHLEVRNRALLAQWVRPLPAVPHGYRHLPLDDHLCSRFVFASLFVRIDVEEVGRAADGRGSLSS
jgi:phosphatidylinositol phospholipase C delta